MVWGKEAQTGKRFHCYLGSNLRQRVIDRQKWLAQECPMGSIVWEQCSAHEPLFGRQSQGENKKGGDYSQIQTNRLKVG